MNRKKISPDLSLALNGLLSSSLDELKFTVNNISMENIDKTVDYLSSNKTIHLFAKGLSEMPFNYMYNILLADIDIVINMMILRLCLLQLHR